MRKGGIIHPNKVKRESLENLTDLPNIGPSIAGDLRQIGIHSPTDIIGRDPYVMHEELCTVTGHRHDPCIIDVFIAITRFMAGESPRPWWDFTDERKKRLLSDS